MRPDEIGKKIIEENKSEEVYLIAGVINVTGQMLFWKDEGRMNIGNYAIVENGNGYDLAKIVGIVLTTKEEASKFSKTKYENIKKTIYPIFKEDIER